MKYNTRRRKSAAVKRGKRKNLKNRRKTRRGGTLGRYTTSFKSHSRSTRSTRSDEPADFGADRFRGMLLHMLANKDIPDETKNILKEIQDSQVDDRYNWDHVYIKLRHIPRLANINVGNLDVMNAVRILMKKLSKIDYDYAFRELSYAPGYIGYNP